MLMMKLEPRMKMTVVGCGDAFCSDGRGHACFRVEANGVVVAFDFGATALAAWRRLGFCPANLDAVVVSHLHGDHFGGLPFLLLSLQYEKQPRKPLLIVGPRGTREALERAVALFYPHLGPREWKFEWRVEEVSAGSEISVLGATLKAFRARHGEALAALGFRFESAGGVFTYSGDTGWTEELVEASRGADLLVVECSTADREIPGHIDLSTLRREFGRLAARRVAVTHMGAGVRARQDELTALGLLALDDGQIVEF